LRLSLGDKTVEIKGIVLYLKKSVNRRVPVFYYGIEFEDDSRDAKDAIIVYNFSHAVNKMMKGLSIDNETPTAAQSRTTKQELGFKARSKVIVTSHPLA
ncbi:MAG: hypothetical protein M1610_07665, partial [Nitrospirae bacterium]|nr:hypothetical protein [Nitrospirota bacterium]MDA8338646.1 hypothetical protein [Nitrospiraceae bacterium]